MKKLYLVDTYAFFFRAYYAIPSMTTKKGLPTQALYGLTSMIVKLLREVKPDYMVCCFDRKDGSFRNEFYPEYKAHRDDMPEDLIPQVPYIRQVLEALGITCMDQKGFEADDVIGSLTHWGREHQLEVIIVSSDKDFAQLIGPHVTMLDVMKDKHYDEAKVLEKWGVVSQQMIDYLAIVGDSSDNIPGVKGIGPKGAQKLLAEFKTLNGIYDHLEEVKAPGLLKKLKEHRESAYLSQKLVTIVIDIPIEYEPDDLKLKKIHRDELKKLFEELEFQSFERKLLSPLPKDSLGETNPPGGANVLDEVNSPDGANPTYNKRVDGERRKRGRQGAWREVTWSLSELKKNIQPYSELWVIFNERGLILGYKGEAVTVIDAEVCQVGLALGSKYLQWKGYGLKEIWKKIKLPHGQIPSTDIMLMAYILKPGNIESFESIYEMYTGQKVPDLPTASHLLKMQVELEHILEKQLVQSAQNGHVLKILKDMEYPLVPVLFDMEQRGIALDASILQKESQALEKDMNVLEKSIQQTAEEPFNVASPKQLAHILFEKMGLPSSKKTKIGYSTASDVLEKLASLHPICREVLEYRELSKLKSTYVDALPQLICHDTGRIHTCFRQAATTTGRLSSIHPNLQNIPIRTKRGRLVRQAFMTLPGHQLISADYSQIELRILAHITEDPGLCEAFRRDLDIHAATAAEVFHLKVEDITADHRRIAKAVNFGIAYGQGAFSLGKSLGLSRSESQEIIDNYFRKFKGVKRYMEQAVEMGRKDGYVSSLFGRRRYLNGLQARHGAVRRAEERAAINAPIQGTASDIVKKAMIAIHNESTASMLIQVHDELLFECPDEDVQEQRETVKRIMESVVELKVPLKVNTAVGPNWVEAHA